MWPPYPRSVAAGKGGLEAMYFTTSIAVAAGLSLAFGIRRDMVKRQEAEKSDAAQDAGDTLSD